MDEIWKDVPDYEDFYQASNLGRVRRIQYGPRGHRAPFLKPQKNPVTKYHSVSLSLNGRHKRHNLHSLIARTFLGECEDGMEINHIDGDRSNNAVSNLEYVTHSYNNLHAYRTLGRKVGMPNKINREQACEIRILAAQGVSYSALSERFGITPNSIKSVVKFITWKEK